MVILIFNQEKYSSLTLFFKAFPEKLQEENEINNNSRMSYTIPVVTVSSRSCLLLANKGARRSIRQGEAGKSTQRQEGP